MEYNILKTLVYADIFDYPLTEKEITERLIVTEGTDNPRVIPTNIDKGLDDLVAKRKLDQLVAEGKLERRGKYYFIPGRKDIVGLRKKREKYSKEKMGIADRAAKWVKLIPTVKFVGVTGSVAAGNAKKSDDIDFFVISASGWLWTTRLLTTLLLELIGKRRRPGEGNSKDKICLNLFVDEANLDVFGHNLFTAYELVQLKPLVDKKNIYQDLLSTNSWVKGFLPNASKFESIKNLGSDNSSRRARQNWSQRRLWVGSRTIFDELLMRLQIWWMKNRQTTEITEPDLIAFHPDDISQKVLEEYENRCARSPSADGEPRPTA